MGTLSSFKNMIQQTRISGRISRKPLWLRLSAVLCLLLFALVSTAQVCHTHQDLQPASHHNAPAPDHCPLCVAMHSALPTTLHAVPQPILHVHALTVAAQSYRPASRFALQLASRPPPVA